MIKHVILEDANDANGSLISYDHLMTPLTRDQVERTLRQHHDILSFTVIDDVAKVVLY